MPIIKESDQISGLYTTQLQAYGDERGRFIETFRKEWFPQRSWDILQANHAESTAGVLRGLHYHHHQVDYWYVIKGVIRVGLFDLRPSSPTYCAGHIIEMSGDNPAGLFIPTGVAHGYLALTDITLTYLVDNYYDGRDENGVAWNDPDVGLDWGIESPIVSPRDAGNPRLQEILSSNLPGYGQE